MTTMPDRRVLVWPERCLLSAAAWVQDWGRDERGQTLAEYGLIITLVAVGTTLLALIAFREDLITGFNSMSSCLTGGVCGP
jgi:Flp pilus assembly pilin Flp